MYKKDNPYGENEGCIDNIITTIMMVATMAGCFAAFNTYLLVVGEKEPTAELLGYIVIGWVAYLLVSWFWLWVESKDDDSFSDKDRFIIFLKTSFSLLATILGGAMTVALGLKFFSSATGAEFSQANVRDGLLAIAFFIGGILVGITTKKLPGKKLYRQYAEKWDGQYPEKWGDIRQIVLERDEYRCANCQSTENLHVHHIVPLSLGGSNELSNLKTLCKNCHTRLHPHMRD